MVLRELCLRNLVDEKPRSLSITFVEQLLAQCKAGHLTNFLPNPLNYSFIQQTLNNKLLFICFFIYSFDKYLLSTDGYHVPPVCYEKYK